MLLSKECMDTSEFLKLFEENEMYLYNQDLVVFNLG